MTEFHLGPVGIREHLNKVASAYAASALRDDATSVFVSLATYHSGAALFFIVSDVFTVGREVEPDAANQVFWSVTDWAYAIRGDTGDTVVISFMDAKFPAGKPAGFESVSLRAFVRIDEDGAYKDDKKPLGISGDGTCSHL